MRKFLMISLLAVLVIACDKNQKTVKRLDGTWNTISYVETWDGTSEDLVVSEGYSLTLAFDNCKLKDDEFCQVIWTESYSGESTYVQVLDYRVAGYGTSLELREPTYPSELLYLSILEFEKDKLVLQLDDGDGYYVTITLEK